MTLKVHDDVPVLSVFNLTYFENFIGNICGFFYDGNIPFGIIS